MDSTGLVVSEVSYQSSASLLVNALVNIFKCRNRVYQLAQCLSFFHPSLETLVGALQRCFRVSGPYGIAFIKPFFPDKMSNISITSCLEASSTSPARVLNIVSSSLDRHTSFATLFTERFQCTEHPRNSFSVMSFPRTFLQLPWLYSLAKYASLGENSLWPFYSQKLVAVIKIKRNFELGRTANSMKSTHKATPNHSRHKRETKDLK